MPYLFFEIERQKNWIIGWLFIFLVSLYFLSFLVIWFIKKIFVHWYWFLVSEGTPKLEFLPLKAKNILIVFFISLIVGAIHWFFSQYDMVNKILTLLKAEPTDQNDKYHHVFKNIVEEASIACGNIKFEPYLISTSALNAFSVSDFRGRRVIGITEGLLNKLNRRQIQAVAGHEIAHILSGDCLSSTVACSIFAFYAGMLKILEKTIEADVDSEGNMVGSLLLIPIYGVFSIINNLSYLINVFISRQREYRADSIAVRLTRDPLSLAEALYIISRGWKGDGIPGAELSSIFIANPQHSIRDDEEGFLADTLSTHPPIKKRIEVLLNMAGAGTEVLETAITEKETSSRNTHIDYPQDKKWLIADANNQWLGPFTLSETLALDWLRPNFWIRVVGDEKARLAYEFPELKMFFQPQEATASSQYSCPSDYHGLEKIEYEGRMAWQCPLCKGLLVKRLDFKLILIRKEKVFPDNVIKQADLLIQDARSGFKLQEVKADNLLKCSLCNKKMSRIFFNWGQISDTFGVAQWDRFLNNMGLKGRFIMPIAIDRCIWCDSYWLDNRKLEIIQHIYEKYGNE